MTKVTTLRPQLRAFILESFLFSDDDGILQDSDSFLEQGIIDSTGVMEIILFLEEELGLTVEDHEMIPANLDSIDRIVAYVERKRGE